ncbi:MAG: hypothetical protein KF778_08765 [Rhodocyclaceae bacterium]|nr:hypothetical protein [Rhodocyclaceae bacterium]MBX3668479.1 hypothetical protein [Rhodocyclaceae bacterium]
MNPTNILQQFAKASQQTGRSTLSMLIEWAQLRAGAGKVGISEYFDYQIYRPELSGPEKASFASYRVQNVLEQILVDDYSRILSLDKVSYYLLMEGNGLPVPHTHALYAPSGRYFPRTLLRTPGELADWLAASTAYPLYLKPSFGGHGKGNLTLLNYANGEVEQVGGKRVPVRQLAESIEDRLGFGWMVQESLRPHPDIAKRCGDRISGVRIHAFLSKSGPRILIGVWKINSGLCDSDNFLQGKVGNLVAEIDVTSGCITRVVTGIGVDARLVESHPVTGAKLLGYELPDWDKLVALIGQAATVFPGYIYQGWDIALTDRGPVPLEVNYFGDVDLPQFATGKGFLSPELLDCMRELGLDTLLPGPSRFAQFNPNGRFGRRRVHWPY